MLRGEVGRLSWALDQARVRIDELERDMRELIQDDERRKRALGQIEATLRSACAGFR